MLIGKTTICRLRTCVFAVSLAVMTTPAMANYGGFSIPLLTAWVSNGASLTFPNIHLPKSGTPSFFINFALPPDYKNGEPAFIIFYLQAGSGAFPCTVVLEPISLLRQRPGLNPLNTPTALKGSVNISVPRAVEIVQKVFRLRRSGAFPGQRPGDSFIAGFRRNSTDVEDTCDDSTLIRNIIVKYPRP